MGTLHRTVQEYLAKHPEDKRVVEPFLHGFSVTRAARRASGSGEISVFYLKTDTAMSQLLGLEREMLLVYAPFSEFQARTTEIHDAARFSALDQPPISRPKMAVTVKTRPHLRCTPNRH